MLRQAKFRDCFKKEEVTNSAVSAERPIDEDIIVTTGFGRCSLVTWMRVV